MLPFNPWPRGLSPPLGQSLLLLEGSGHPHFQQVSSPPTKGLSVLGRAVLCVKYLNSYHERGWNFALQVSWELVYWLLLPPSPSQWIPWNVSIEGLLWIVSMWIHTSLKVSVWFSVRTVPIGVWFLTVFGNHKMVVVIPSRMFLKCLCLPNLLWKAVLHNSEKWLICTDCAWRVNRGVSITSAKLVWHYWVPWTSAWPLGEFRILLRSCYSSWRDQVPHSCCVLRMHKVQCPRDLSSDCQMLIRPILTPRHS